MAEHGEHSFPIWPNAFGLSQLIMFLHHPLSLCFAGSLHNCWHASVTYVCCSVESALYQRQFRFIFVRVMYLNSYDKRWLGDFTGA